MFESSENRKVRESQLGSQNLVQEDVYYFITVALKFTNILPEKFT